MQILGTIFLWSSRWSLQPGDPRQYHCPLSFFGGIEYCLSAQCFDGEVHFFVSHWDRESYVVVAELPELHQLTQSPE